MEDLSSDNPSRSAAPKDTCEENTRDLSGRQDVGGEGGQLGENEESGFTPEEGKLWATVQETSSDFSSWTKLLQMVEQRCELKIIRKVFDSFVKLFPYCYGYWKKYADLEHKLATTESAIKVFERGVIAIPFSVDLWLHYLKFTTANTTQQPDYKASIRSLYDRAIETCGLDFRSDKIWLAYIEWEKSNCSITQNMQAVVAIYDRLLATPTQQHQHHYESFQSLVSSTPPQQLMAAEDYQKLLHELKKHIPLGDEATYQRHIQFKIIEQRQGIFHITEQETLKRRHFEDNIKRPYFHVKPLERSQLKNWREYLNYEIEQGDLRRILTLFERCMIACCLYEEFWLKFAKFTMEKHTADYTRSVFSRACQIHLRHKPTLHVAWAAYEEQQGNTDGSRAILSAINMSAPGYVLVQLRQVGLEVRLKEYERADSLFSLLVSGAENNESRAFYSWRYARFLAKVLGDLDKAIGVMKAAVKNEPANLTLHLQLLDLVLSRCPVREEEVEEVFQEALVNQELSEDNKDTIANHRLQFLEEFSSDINKVVKVFDEQQRSGRRSQSRKRSVGGGNVDAIKKTKQDTQTSCTSTPSPTCSSLQPSTSSSTTTAYSTSSSLPATPTIADWSMYTSQQQWGVYPGYGQGYGYQQWSGYQFPPYTTPQHQ